ncbi:MAG: serine hydrolase domain-containing protein [Nocardioidaceae bacterium]
MSSPLPAAATRIADSLVRTTPERGPSAAVVGMCDIEHGPVTVERGFARVLDEYGRAMPPVPLAEEPVFDVGSVTKVAATTTLCMHLVDAGRLGLDEPVAQRLPGFTGEVKDSVTVRDLLEHQAGLWEWWPIYLDPTGTGRHPLDVAQRLSLRYRPRTGRRYSDLGFMLLGEIVARAYGEPLEPVARRIVFDPLGMHDTGYRDGANAASSDRVVATSVGDWYERRMVETGSPYPVPLRADAFAGWRTHTLAGEPNDGNCWHAFGGVAGHAGLFTTVTDLLRLGTALLSSLEDGGPWSRQVVAEFLAPGREPTQALGFWLRPGARGAVVEHSGFPGARFAVLPQRRRVAVLLTNRLHTTGEPINLDRAWSELIEAAEAA